MSLVREFQSLSAFGAHLERLAVESHEVEHFLAARGADMILRDAKWQIGTYQPAVGPFAAWAPLAESTEAEKSRKGYPLDAPLLRDGTLRASYQADVEGGDAVIGSTSDIALWQEVGTVRIPPRAVLGPAAVSSRKPLMELTGVTLLAWVTGRGWRRPARASRMETKG